MNNPSQPGALPASEAIDLSNCVSYSQGAVVSRTLAKTGGGTLTVFAFDAGEGISEHSAPFDAHVLVLEGKLELTIGGSPVSVDPGQIVRMPADIPHALRATERTKMFLIMVKQALPNP